MISVEILSRTAGVASADIESWVELTWLQPAGEPGRWLFREVDVARVRLISELRGLRIDEEAMPVVLSLLDQLYASRHRLRQVTNAIQQAAPDTVRDKLLALLRDDMRD